jgi:hypothetical protein
MPRGDKSSYNSKQKRQAEHIEKGYEKKGVSKKTAQKRAWATVNKETGGAKKAVKKSAAKKVAKKAATKRATKKSASKRAAKKATTKRSPSSRSTAAKKAARTRAKSR